MAMDRRKLSGMLDDETPLSVTPPTIHYIRGLRQHPRKQRVPQADAVEVEMPQFYINFPRFGRPWSSESGSGTSSTGHGSVLSGQSGYRSLSTVDRRGEQEHHKRKKYTTTIVTTTTTTKIFLPGLLRMPEACTTDSGDHPGERLVVPQWSTDCDSNGFTPKQTGSVEGGDAYISSPWKAVRTNALVEQLPPPVKPTSDNRALSDTFSGNKHHSAARPCLPHTATCVASRCQCFRPAAVCRMHRGTCSAPRTADGAGDIQGHDRPPTMRMPGKCKGPKPHIERGCAAESGGTFYGFTPRRASGSAGAKHTPEEMRQRTQTVALDPIRIVNEQREESSWYRCGSWEPGSR
uniref:WGS project CAEQ00000000 data, annotated contig 560 n=1 Tax=Trypanosoma congolense (strain IL3000) TaxID=1068625 RepID=F9WGW2_TRYCI|nr:unnamed protein product [Trypanosoma congolense IL3000]